MSKPSTTAGSFKTPLRRARGLGAAHSGVGGFIAERVSWMALIPLGLWAVWAVFTVAPAGYDGAVGFLHSPVQATLAVLFAAVLFFHVRLVVKEALEDYIGGHHLRLATLLLNTAVVLLGGALAVVSILKVAFSAAP